MSYRIEVARKRAKRSPAGTGKRHHSKNDPLTNKVLHSRLVTDPDAFQSLGAIEAQIDWLTPRIATMEADRADELALPKERRDEHFLANCGSKLRAMRNLQATLRIRRKELRQAELAAANKVSQARRERLFIDAVKKVLPEDTFKRLWSEVNEAAMAQEAA